MTDIKKAQEKTMALWSTRLGIPFDAEVARVAHYNLADADLSDSTLTGPMYMTLVRFKMKDLEKGVSLPEEDKRALWIECEAYYNLDKRDSDKDIRKEVIAVGKKLGGLYETTANKLADGIVRDIKHLMSLSK